MDIENCCLMLFYVAPQKVRYSNGNFVAIIENTKARLLIIETLELLITTVCYFPAKIVQKYSIICCVAGMASTVSPKVVSKLTMNEW